MNRRSLLAALIGSQIPVKQDGEWTVRVAPKKAGYCPACGEKAKSWDPDKKCRYEQSIVMMDDNAFIYSPFPSKVVNPEAPPCGNVDLFTGTRDWRRHICHNCKAMFAIPKGFLGEAAK